MFALAVLLVFAILIGHPWFYFADEIELRVVDADTKDPIAGVIVTANWQLIHSTPGGAVQGGQINVMETVSNKQGNVRFTSWGPRFALLGRLGYRRPQLLLFKPGYEISILQNSTGDRITGSVLIESDWNGKTVNLKSGQNVPDARLSRLIKFSKEIDFFSFSGRQQCNWLKLPDTLTAINRERAELEKIGYFTTTERTIDQALIHSKSDFVSICGNAAQEIIEDMKK